VISEDPVTDRTATREETDAALQSMEERPIMIALDAQEIGRMWATKTSPTAFNQYLLEKFRAAGAPVEGVLKLTLAHGRLARLKPEMNAPQDGFRYMWLPDAWATAMIKYQKWSRGEV